MSSALTLDTYLSLILFVAFLALAVHLAKIPISTLVRNLKPFTFLFVFTVILHAVMTPGPSLFHIPGFHITVSEEGLRFGFFFCIRLASLVSIAALMTLTTTPLALANGLERMLSPLKKFGFPAHEFAMMISISIRFIPVLAEEAERIRNAQVARGADFSGNLLRRAKKMVPVLVPLFQSAFERADHLAMAMESRCYQGGDGRTSYRVLAFSRSDLAASCVVATASLIMLLRSGYHIWQL